MPTVWLQSLLRSPCQYTRFQVTDTIHSEPPSEQVRDRLARLLESGLFDAAFLSALADDLGWENVRDFVVREGVTNLDRVKRGEFGEAVGGAILEKHQGYVIPIRKLRFKTGRNTTLHSTDILALKLDGENQILEACYVESKLRTTADDSVAIEGCKQLVEDRKTRLPPILQFIAARLYDSRSSLFIPFAQYMKARVDSKEMDTFKLVLCTDSNVWSEEGLSALEEAGLELGPLEVVALRITDLRSLTDDVFARIGVREVSDDD